MLRLLLKNTRATDVTVLILMVGFVGPEFTTNAQAVRLHHVRPLLRNARR